MASLEERVTALELIVLDLQSEITGLRSSVTELQGGVLDIHASADLRRQHELYANSGWKSDVLRTSKLIEVRTSTPDGDAWLEANAFLIKGPERHWVVPTKGEALFNDGIHAYKLLGNRRTTVMQFPASPPDLDADLRILLSVQVFGGS